MTANPAPHGLSQPLGGEGGGPATSSSFGIRSRNHSSSSSMGRVRNSVESLLSRASRDNLLSSRGGQGSNAPGANATFDVVDVPTGGGNSALFVRSGGLPPPLGGIDLGTTGPADGSGNTGGPKENDANCPASSSSPATTSSEALSKPAAGGCAPASSTAAVTANVRYRNDQGRQAVLAVARSINHDFSALTSIMNVTLGSVADLDVLSASEDIEWVDKNGAVFVVQPFGKS